MEGSSLVELYVSLACVSFVFGILVWFNSSASIHVESGLIVSLIEKSSGYDCIDSKCAGANQFMLYEDVCLNVCIDTRSLQIVGLELFLSFSSSFIFKYIYIYICSRIF